MTRTSIASRFVAPAGLALAILMLAASPVGFGKTGLMLQSAKAETSIDKQGPDLNSVDTNSPDRSSNDSSGVNGNAGTNSGSGDAGGSSNGGSHDGAGDR